MSATSHAVSYTHLDVYKRQDMSLLQLRNPAQDLLPILQDPTLNPPSSSQDGAQEAQLTTGSATSSGIESQAYEDIPCSAGHNSCSVSYTHLDVYKRQPFIPLHPAHVPLPLVADTNRRPRMQLTRYMGPNETSF